MSKEFKGAYTALITPMKDDGTVDYDGFRRLIAFQIEEGINGLVPLGTTGETPTLDDDEEENLIKIAVEETAGRVPLIIGAGSNSTRHMEGYVKRAQDLGADAVLVVSPYYNKPNDSGMIRHFEIAAAAGLPVIIYNIASRTGRNIPVSLMEKLACIPGIVGVKESSGDIIQMMEIIERIALPRKGSANPFWVLSGDDNFTLPLLALGGDGLVSVISNLIPGKIAALVKACLNGGFAEARRLHYELLPLMRHAFIETNPVPVKAAMNWAALPSGPVRLPLGPLSAANEKVLRQTILDAGFTIKQ
ncbi:MAG: 4-hydroxy-tetrahydrodipicolinate synthase [Spirochaetaceae bacterium]|jgi:4-hydroxy-tetrahydrodipicolinate synthase|nr:4-hydroxy-tetrahydrodipicolinate synthase [Spirochaetaceae bacterium]